MRNAFYSTKLRNSINVMKDVNHASIENMDISLMVNCAHCCNTTQSHTNRNVIGRRDYYLIYFIEGEYDVTADCKKALMKGGEVLVIPPKTKYEILCSGNHMYFLCVHFTGNEARKLLNINGINIFPYTNQVAPINSLFLRFKDIFDAFSMNDEFRGRELACLLERLLIEIGRAKKSFDGSAFKISKSISYIDENYTQRIKISELAQMETMCLTAYNKHFKVQMGVTPSKYIIALRMQMAKELLETSSLSIKEISSMCGYDNFNFFARMFKKHTGQTPTDYKKQN